jgi:hypothetical protein
MKTEIELTKEQLGALEHYCVLMHASRDKVVGQALEVFLQGIAPPSTKSLREHPGFGCWKNRSIEGVSYQQTLREEWPEL